MSDDERTSANAASCASRIHVQRPSGMRTRGNRRSLWLLFALDAVACSKLLNQGMLLAECAEVVPLSLQCWRGTQLVHHVVHLLLLLRLI